MHDLGYFRANFDAVAARLATRSNPPFLDTFRNLDARRRAAIHESEELKARIDKTLDDLRKDLSRIRTGRASLALLDGIRVDYYGTATPLSGVASLSVPEPRLITIKPWDPSQLKEIEKAITEIRTPSRIWVAKVSAAMTMLRNGSPVIEPDRSSTCETLSGASAAAGGRPRTLMAA